MTPAGHGRTLLRQSITSVFDQAWLSALNLALGLVLIRLTSPQSYGIYAQLFAGGVFAVVIAESLIVNPLTTLAAALPSEQRDAMAGRVGRLHNRLSLALACLFGVVAGFVLAQAGAPQSIALAAAFAAYVYTSARREFQRSVGFIQNRPGTVLRTDLIYGAALALAIGLLAATGSLSLPLVMVAMTLANLWPLLRGPRLATPAADTTADRRHAGQMWQRGRLGLPGAVSSWIVNYSYLYIVAAWLGAASAAELNASRLLLMPIALLVVAWSRVARPLISRLILARELRTLVQLLVASAAALEVVMFAYVGVLWLLTPWLLARVLGAAYAGLGWLVALWTLYFALYALRWIGSVLLLSADGYHMLLVSSLCSLVVLAMALPLGLVRFGTAGAVGALIAVEFFMLLLVWAAFVPITLRRLRADTGNDV